MKKIFYSVFLILFAAGFVSVFREMAQPYAFPNPGDFIDVSGKTRVECKEVLQGRVMVAMAFGQSNSANTGETRYTPKGKVYNFYDGKCYVAADPMLGTSGTGGSVWSRLGDKLIDEGLYDSVMFVTLGVGGTEVRRWTPDGDLHRRITDVIRELKRAKIKPTHIFWHQGESDKGLKTTKADYMRMFNEMLGAIRQKGLDAPIFVAVATRCGGGGPGYEIRQAQKELVNTEKGIYPGPDTDALDSLADRHDACHFSATGIEKHADLWLQAIKFSGK